MSEAIKRTLDEQVIIDRMMRILSVLDSATKKTEEPSEDYKES